MSQPSEASSSTREPIVCAAGAIPFRLSPLGIEVLLVYRSRHGGGWTLPKGKLKPHESWDQAARREVREETGYDIQLGSFVGAVAYDAGGAPKVVRFWQAQAVGVPAPDSERDREVDKVEWLPLDQAPQRLRYPLERALLEIWQPAALRTLRPVIAESTHTSWLSRLHDGRGLSARRLRCALPLLSEDLARAARRSPEALREADDLQGWMASAVRLLLQSQRAIDRGDSQLGWRCFKASARAYLLTLNPADPTDCGILRSRAAAVLRESDQKLKGWRKQAIQDLLTKEGKPDPMAAAGSIAEAARMLDEHHDNVYDRLGLLRTQLLGLSLAAAAVVGLWLFLRNTPPEWHGSWQDWTMIVLLGVMGAILSGFLRAGSGRGVRIPEQLSSVSLTFARFALAAIAAIAITLLMESHFIKYGDELVWVTAFAAGFSERLVVDALNELTRKAQGAASPEEAADKSHQ